MREGRRREFASFAAFSDPARRAKIPDPNAIETFERSRPRADPEKGAARHALYRKLLALRREHLFPRLDGATSIGAQAIGPAAVVARWRLGDGAVLTLAANLGAQPCAFDPPVGALIFETECKADASSSSQLNGYTTLAFLEHRRG